jgi:hypothetical protein
MTSGANGSARPFCWTVSGLSVSHRLSIKPTKDAVMNRSHELSLYGERPNVPSGGYRWLRRAIMLPFEVLHRQRWSAPWQAARPAPHCQR